MGHRIATLAIALVATIVALAIPLAGAPTSAGAQTPLPDLVLVKSDDPDPVVSGDPITYSIVVTNNGTASAGSPSDPVNIIDHLPLQFTLGSFSIAPTGSCGFVPPQDVDCQVDTLAPGDSVKLTIDGYVTMPFGGQVKNMGVVDLPVSQISETIDTSNNIASETTTILAITTPTPTASDTPTPTETSTPTTTPRPVGGVSYDIAGLSPEAASDDSPSPDGVPIAGVIGLVAGLLAASACVRYVKRRARA